MVKLEPPQSASRPIRLLVMSVVRREGALDLIGLTFADRELFAELAVTTEAISWDQLIARAADRKIAIMIRSDLPVIP